MKCPFELPVEVIESNGSIVDAKNVMILKVLYSHKTFDLQIQQLHYTAKAINSHDKLIIDNSFLLARSMKAGSCSFREGRDTGISSNSIVAIAFDVIKLNEQEMPNDKADLAACIRAFDKLPYHRRTKDALEALKRAKQALEAENP